MSRVAIFGGTFNPIHNGHIMCASECVRQIGCDKLIFVPSNIPPHKVITSHRVTLLDRFKMCEMAIKDNDKFGLSDYELRNEGVSYTVYTLEHFTNVLKDAELFLLIGQDMFCTLLDWKEPENIFKMSYICVAQREKGELVKDSYYIEKLKKMGARLVFLDLEPFEVSSTFIRESIKSGRDVSKYLPYDVWNYVMKRKLYI